MGSSMKKLKVTKLKQVTPDIKNTEIIREPYFSKDEVPKIKELEKERDIVIQWYPKITKKNCLCSLSKDKHKNEEYITKINQFLEKSSHCSVSNFKKY